MIADVMTGRGPVIRVLGPVEVIGPNGESVCVGGKPATVLVALALNSGAWTPTDRLVDLVWPDREPPASATNNLKTYVWQLRRLLAGSLGSGRIESRSGGYRLDLRPGELDADVVASAADQVGELLRDGRPAEVAGRVPEVLALWRGRAYDEVADHWAHPALARLREQRFVLRESLAEAYLILGRTADAIELLTAITAEEPSRELAWAKLVDTFRRAGRVLDALTAYQRARTGLIEDLGIDPGPELEAAHRAVLAGGPDGGPDGAVSGAASPGWPQPRQLPRPATLVGRREELEALIDAGRSGWSGWSGTPAPVLTVTGMAGIGKTAVAVAAGHALAEDYPDGQLFVDLGTHTASTSSTNSTDKALGRLIRSVLGPGTSLPDACDERAALWRSAAYGRRLLVLVDDVRDAEQLAPLLPASAECLVLATGRNRLSGLDESTDVRLNVLSDEDADRLLLRRAGPLTADVATEVLRVCAGHPAAVRSLADQLRDRPAWAASRLREMLADPCLRRQQLVDVHRRLDASYRLLPESVRTLYRRLGSMAGFETDEAAALAAVLVDRNLAVETAPGRFTRHPLVRDHAGAWSTADAPHLSTVPTEGMWVA